MDEKNANEKLHDYVNSAPVCRQLWRNNGYGAVPAQRMNSTE